MKDQYVLGLPQDDFIRVNDGTYMVGCSKDLESAKDIKKRYDNNSNQFKIYKLVEVKQ